MEQNISFPSEVKNIIIAENLVDEISEKFNLGSEIYGNILISIIEAVNNAIVHGNGAVPSKKVSLSYNINGKFLSFKIADEGEGFDFKKTPDPTTPENIEKPHGRGVYLMQNLADEVNFYENGATVELKFII